MIDLDDAPALNEDGEDGRRPNRGARRRLTDSVCHHVICMPE
jgi:hypothetical protein